ncbi:AzlD domain-containing protein [Kushneria aurantia]|uniref:AzlD domain-containing protein n=1 Tax=Kushneria aurantia TaxID=504092 RepID=A0ABV6G879_9GAMM|nr:AzlD domain-containing protein [Kushneria aurantia]
MSASHFGLIALLSLLAFSVRLAGLFAGRAIGESRLAFLLDELPGLIIVALVAASMATEPGIYWIAGGIALLTAWKTRNIIATMGAGMTAHAAITFMGA